MPAFSTTTWEVVKVGAVAHMPLAERLAYSRLYFLIENQNRVVDQEREALTRVVGNLGGTDVRSLLADAKQAKFRGTARAALSSAILDATKALGVEPAPMSIAQRDTLAGFCTPLPRSSEKPNL